MERCFPVPYGAVFLWGIAVLLGMIGLGRLVALITGGESARQAGWGLHAVWGMAAYLVVGGILGVFSLCGQIAITLMILLGVGFFVRTTFGAWRPARADFARIPWAALPALVVAATNFSAGVFRQTYLNEADDLPAYYNFCENLLATGSFPDPFSWRRLASLGGQTMLQCSVLAQTSWANAQAFEAAMCPVILLGLVLGFRRGALARSWLGLVLALAAVTSPILHTNTASAFTGTIMLAGLFVTLDLVDRDTTHRHRLYAVAGMVAAGLCSLRAQDIPVALGALDIFWLFSWMTDKRPARDALKEAFYWGAGIFVALLPWMITSFLSGGSPMFPLFQGNNNLAFNPQGGAMPLVAALKFVFRTMTYPVLLPPILCILAATLLRPGLAAKAVSIAAVLTSLVVAYGLNLAPDEATIPRYVQPFLVSAAFAVLMSAAVSTRLRLVTWAMAALLLGASIRERAEAFWGDFAAISNGGGLKMPATFRSNLVASYGEAQSLIPEGKRILVCGDYPFLFDHRRNPVWIIDLPHAASPPPGLPFQKPPEETKRYLQKLGVDYLIFQDFSKKSMIYNRGEWIRIRTEGAPLLKIQTPYFLDFFDTVEGLAASETVLGRAGDLTVVQLKP